MPKPTAEKTAVAVDRIARIALEATDAGRIASDHMMKSSEADYDLNRQFVYEMAAWKAEQHETPLPRRKRVVMTSVNTCEKSLNVVDPDWAAFCKRVDETDCSSQWADRGQDH